MYLNWIISKQQIGPQKKNDHSDWLTCGIKPKFNHKNHISPKILTNKNQTFATDPCWEKWKNVRGWSGVRTLYLSHLPKEISSCICVALCVRILYRLPFDNAWTDKQRCHISLGLVWQTHKPFHLQPIGKNFFGKKQEAIPTADDNHVIIQCTQESGEE